MDTDLHAKLDALNAYCDAWEESKHPRASNGRFGKGSGTPAAATAEKKPRAPDRMTTLARGVQAAQAAETSARQSGQGHPEATEKLRQAETALETERGTVRRAPAKKAANKTVAAKPAAPKAPAKPANGGQRNPWAAPEQSTDPDVERAREALGEAYRQSYEDQSPEGARKSSERIRQALEALKAAKKAAAKKTAGPSSGGQVMRGSLGAATALPVPPPGATRKEKTAQAKAGAESLVKEHGLAKALDVALGQFDIWRQAWTAAEFTDKARMREGLAKESYWSDVRTRLTEMRDRAPAKPAVRNSATSGRLMTPAGRPMPITQPGPHEFGPTFGPGTSFGAAPGPMQIEQPGAHTFRHPPPAPAPLIASTKARKKA